MPELGAHYAFRDELAERLTADILGPTGGEEETLSEEPTRAYITGVLFPRTSDPESASVDGQALEDEPERGDFAPDEPPDSGVALANVQYPSAMGLTFAIDTAIAARVLVSVDGGRYDAIDTEGRIVEAEWARSRSTEEARLRWRRSPVRARDIEIDPRTPGHGECETDALPATLRLAYRVRRAGDDGTVTVTVTLVNSASVAPGQVRDAHCYFQTRLTITTDADLPAFVERSAQQMADDHEVHTSRLLHRHAPLFATGHGCAADWEWAPPAPHSAALSKRARTNIVHTTFVPRKEVLLTDSNPQAPEIGMRWLARAGDEEVFSVLHAFVEEYRGWISQRRGDVPALQEEFRNVGAGQLRACVEAADRMEAGVQRLRDDPLARRAFRLANEAMAQQRARTAWMRSGRKGSPDTDAGRWRPFQLGFLLLCLNGVADERHEDREVADLLWFPTGGGKTEAYLGMIAFTIFLRRLKHGTDTGGGVTVLMRYTLRLLTLQQFERAATLMCAMDLIRRRDEGSLGDEAISIGMWVGQAATPNRLVDASEGIKRLRAGETLQEKNPVQLRACPWCGTPIDAHDHHVDLAADPPRMLIACRNSDCEFAAGLPVHLVDQAIYSVRPSLVIATSDKFAQIAWRARVAELFNLVGAPDGTPPPELIIQDELHLISGPLGTLAGLYETAIDVVAKRPKVIASTATIRKAAEQGKRLFDRRVAQFPPAGLDARDSWFAVQARRETKATRTYTGLFAPATSQATLLIRAYASLLHHGAHIEGSDDVRDAYWTLIGYFNSLRLLASAELQVHADVAERLRQLGKETKLSERSVEVLLELTSRVESSAIPMLLESLYVAHPSQDAADVVLATNMISVGVDVDRLGLMAVMGQPQTTAEYIQATSRVGRRHPGLIVTLFNAARSRDRSHYEDFVSYHSALYRQVESTSVTPFAARARDRAIHAALVGIVRMTVPQARPNEGAARIADFLPEVDEAKRAILNRVERIDGSEYDRAERELDAFVEHWRDMAEKNQKLVYEAPRRRGPGQKRRADDALLASYGGDVDLENAADTMWSLRDVDAESDLYLER